MRIATSVKARAALFRGAALLALVPIQGAAAQTAANSDTVAEVIVTGSRIARRDYTSASPVLTVSEEQLERFSVATPDQYLKTLPQMGTTFGEASNNAGNSGIATANLHNLGSARTLVLIDGRRMIGSDGASTVDISTVPTALIKSVEVITGGASAVYGSDAIAGVVNFKLDDRYVGLKVSALGGITDRSDGEQYYTDVVYGWRPEGARGGIVAFASYAERGSVRNEDRKISARGITTTFDAAGNPVFSPRVLNPLPEGVYTPTLTNLPTAASVNAVFAGYGVAAGRVTPTSTLGFNSDNSLFNNAPLINYRNGQTVVDPYYANVSEGAYLLLPSKRINVGIFGDYELSDRATLYGRATFQNAKNQRRISAGDLTTSVPLSNPFIPQDLRTILATRPNPTAAVGVTRRLVELGFRTNELDSDLYHGVIGVRGSLASDWTYDAYVSRGQVKRAETQDGSFRTSLANQLLTAADGGRSLCSGGFDIFGLGQVSTACADFLRYSPKQSIETGQTIVEATATGSLLTLPAGAMKVAVGATYRKETYQVTADPLAPTGDVVAFRLSQNLDAEVSVKEIYGEIAIPILADLPLVHRLEATAGYRYSDYSSVGGVQAYKGDIIYAPIPWMNFRGSFQRAVRAPSFVELFLAPTASNQALAEDPCTFNSSFRTGAVGGVDPARVRALCIAQGIPAAVIDSFVGQRTVTGTSRGNPNLEPEKADTYTAGVVVRAPTDDPWLSGLSLAVDYYDITIKGAIFNNSVDPFLRRCYNLLSGNPGYDANNLFCGVFTRNASGNVTNGVSTFNNVGGSKLAGVDVQLDWSLPFTLLGENPDHRLDLQFVVSRLSKAKTQTLLTDPFIDVLGTISNVPNDSYPEWRTSLSAQLRLGDFDGGVRWRHVDSMITQVKRITPAINSLGTFAVDYVDINVGWRVNDQFSLRAGVENLTDQRAPIYSTPVSSDTNTDPNTFDTLGRRMFIRAAYEF